MPDHSALNAALIETVRANMLMPLPQPVAAAFRAVPRHLFVPGVPLEAAYEDAVIVIKDVRGEPRSSSSQPTIMAVMLTQLDLRDGDRVLEIGAGSGYNAALIAALVGRRGRVVTVDLDEEIAAGARANLRAACTEGVEVVAGDGAEGFSPGAPYDRLIATAAVWDVPAAWIDQLASDGRVVMPLMVHGAQACVAFRRTGRVLESDSIVDGAFMPLRGASARAAPARVMLGPRAGLSVEVPARGHLPASEEALYDRLTGGWTEHATAVRLDDVRDLWRFHQWLALREASFCRVAAYGADAEHDLVPEFPVPGTAQRMSMAAGLADERGLALVAVDATSALVVRAYGGDETCARRVLEHVEAWAASGRETGLPRRIRIYPPDVAAPDGASVEPRRESVVVLD